MTSDHLGRRTPAPRFAYARTFAVAAVGMPLVLLFSACNKEPAAPSLIQTAQIEQRDIVVEAQATGTVEPVDTVAIKSTAGGLVTTLPVEVGSVVKPGDLLVQIDTRDLRNQSLQANAALVAAQARLEVSAAARARAMQLSAQRIITTAEAEAAAADYASAQSAVVTARTGRDIASQRLGDATVRSGVAGTVISKPISVGTVISSATNSVGGGTTLLTIADLSRVRMRALVNETDIGNVQVGQIATVTVDAFPDRRFSGTVEKIEPQAVVQQSVTMFPVLVSLQNPERALLPGMNGEVTMQIQSRENVLAVPNDAVRSVRDLTAAALALGMSEDSVEVLMASARGGQAGGGGNGGAPGRGGDTGTSASVPASDSACTAVTAAIARTPGVQAGLDSLRQQMRAGDLAPAAMRTRAQALYTKAGVDPRAAMGCLRRRAGGTGGAAGAGGAAGGGGAGGGRRQRRAANVGGAGAGDAGANGGPGGAPPSATSRAALTRGVVFVKDSAGWSPRLVQVGVSNYDHTEIRGNVAAGDEVALLGAALLQQERQQRNDRIRSVTGGPLGGGGAAGGRRGGGGGGAH